MNANEKPRQAGNHDRGENQRYIHLMISEIERQELRQQATKLTEILIDLYQRYLPFFYEPPADDPDFDMESGFKTYEALKRQTYGR